LAEVSVVVAVVLVAVAPQGVGKSR